MRYLIHEDPLLLGVSILVAGEDPMRARSRADDDVIIGFVLRGMEECGLIWPDLEGDRLIRAANIAHNLRVAVLGVVIFLAENLLRAAAIEVLRVVGVLERGEVNAAEWSEVTIEVDRAIDLFAERRESQHAMLSELEGTFGPLRKTLVLDYLSSAEGQRRLRVALYALASRRHLS